VSQLRIAHASDLHCCERMRLDDWIALHGTMVGQIAQAKCHLALLTGDLFHARSTPAERNAMAGFLQHLASVCPVAIVKGNHDAAGDLNIFAELETRHAVRIMDRPLVARLATPAGACAVIGCPWFDKAHLVAGLDAAVDVEQSRNLAIAAARQMLTVMRAHAAEARATDFIPIFAGHLMVGGAETSTGQVLIGTTVELSPADILDVGCEYAALGHIHKAQSWFGGKVAYAGSTWRQNFGEAEAKGWWLVGLDDGVFTQSCFVELPARRIVLLEDDATTALDVLSSGVQPGDLVRYRYHIHADQLRRFDADGVRAAILLAGAADVTMEAIIEQEVRQRAPEIVSARDSMAKVDAYLRAKGIEIDEPTRERIRQNLAAIETRLREEVAA